MKNEKVRAKKWVRDKNGCIVGLTGTQKALLHAKKQAIVALEDEPEAVTVTWDAASHTADAMRYAVVYIASEKGGEIIWSGDITA